MAEEPLARWIPSSAYHSPVLHNHLYLISDYPDFFRILEFIKSYDVNISLLTNALKLADINFAERMFSIIDGEKLDVTVAFHSHIPEKHDFLTQHKGSFEKSMKGVENMLKYNVRLSIKNNIVNYTYQSS